MRWAVNPRRRVWVSFDRRETLRYEEGAGGPAAPCRTRAASGGPARLLEHTQHRARARQRRQRLPVDGLLGAGRVVDAPTCRARAAEQPGHARVEMPGLGGEICHFLLCKQNVTLFLACMKQSSRARHRRCRRPTCIPRRRRSCAGAGGPGTGQSHQRPERARRPRAWVETRCGAPRCGTGATQAAPLSTHRLSSNSTSRRLVERGKYPMKRRVVGCDTTSGRLHAGATA